VAARIAPTLGYMLAIGTPGVSTKLARPHLTPAERNPLGTALRQRPRERSIDRRRHPRRSRPAQRRWLFSASFTVARPKPLISEVGYR
jgi:hypothetical protein